MTDKEKIAHFVKHGDSGCQTCVDGMRLYHGPRKVSR